MDNLDFIEDGEMIRWYCLNIWWVYM